MRHTLALSCLVVLGLFPCAADAALVTGTFTATEDADFDLTELGMSDWAYWNTTANPATGGPKTNEKLGGTLISTIRPVGGGDVRGSTSSTLPVYDFLFTDGTSPVAGSVDDVIGLFNTQLDTDGAGVELDVMLPTTGANTVTLFVSGFNGSGALTASLPGAVDFVDTSFTSDGSTPKESAFYTITATPDNPNDLLNLRFVLTSGSTNSHVLFSGVAISAAEAAVPEPATSALAAIGIGCVGLACRRRNRRA